MNDREEILNCFGVGENVVIKFLSIENHIYIAAVTHGQRTCYLMNNLQHRLKDMR